MVCLRNISVDTLHKGDTEDDDDDYNNNNNNNNNNELQKTAVLCTAHTHTTESANVKVQNIFLGSNNIACSKICKYRTAATVCTVETCIVSGI
jgi:hypothetical protein